MLEEVPKYPNFLKCKLCSLEILASTGIQHVKECLISQKTIVGLKSTLKQLQQKQLITAEQNCLETADFDQIRAQIIKDTEPKVLAASKCAEGESNSRLGLFSQDPPTLADQSSVREEKGLFSLGGAKTDEEYMKYLDERIKKLEQSASLTEGIVEKCYFELVKNK